VEWWADIEGAAKRFENLKGLADLSGRFASLDIDDETQAHASRAGEFVLPQVLSLARASHDGADFDGGEGSFEHDIYRLGKYHARMRKVHKNFPLGNSNGDYGPFGQIISRTGKYTLN
jgi:hypothetical protein